jgi:signal transduction histidine kinase
MHDMTDASLDPKWPRLLSLSVHEFRTPMTVVAGYIRMLLKDRAGPITDQQRHLLEEAEKSCGRLSGLLAEMSDLANLEGGKASFNRAAMDLRPLVAEAVADLPAVPDRQISVDLTTGPGAAPIHADAVRLRAALTSILSALRRELVTSTRLIVRERAAEHGGRTASRITIGDAEHIDALETAPIDTLTTFDEWRGGCGLSLAVARRILEAHGGSIWSPPGDTKTGAVVMIPVGELGDRLN